MSCFDKDGLGFTDIIDGLLGHDKKTCDIDDVCSTLDGVMAIGALQMILGLIFLTLSCCCYSGNLKNICDLDLGCDIFSKRVGSQETDEQRTNREHQEWAKKQKRESDNNTADAMIMASSFLNLILGTMTIISYTTSKNDHNDKSYSFLVGIIYWNVAYIVIEIIHFVIGIIYVFKKLPLNFIISLAFGVLSVTSTIVGNGFINSECKYFVKSVQSGIYQVPYQNLDFISSSELPNYVDWLYDSTTQKKIEDDLEKILCNSENKKCKTKQITPFTIAGGKIGLKYVYENEEGYDHIINGEIEERLSRRFSEQKSYEGVEILRFSQLKYHKLQNCEQDNVKLEQVVMCPCNVTGCIGDEYTTTTTTTTINPTFTTKTQPAYELETFLVLYGDEHSVQRPIMLEANNNILLSMQSFDFNEDTGAINSCVILFENVLHIFGGKQHSSYEKQVSIFYSKNKRCGLRNIGSLSSPFIKGTCTLSYDQTVGRDVPFLCFSETDPRGCVSYDGNRETAGISSIANHHGSKIESQRGLVVAAGGHNSRAVEVLISGIWSELEPFPYAESEFHNFAVIRMADDYAGQNELLFYFGGVVDQIVSNRIYTAQIQNLVIKWEKKNQLMMPRRNHNSIRYARDLLFHVGGQNRIQTSRWELEFQGYGSVTKNESWPFLDNYIDPSLFPVDFNECSG